MNNKVFNPNDWLESPRVKKEIREFEEIKETKEFGGIKEIEELVRKIEVAGVDLTTTYKDWLDIGFALADYIGEEGRSYYHRISCFYHNYNNLETDRQYDACLKRHGSGITIKTLFHLAKQAGIDIGFNSNKKRLLHYGRNDMEERGKIVGDSGNELPAELPTFDDKIFKSLPRFLYTVTRHRISDDDGAMLLLGSITVLSACFPNISGIYGGMTVYPNLFLFITAQASAGKGRLTLCRRLAEPIHRQMRDINRLENEEYKRQQLEYSANKKDGNVEQPKEPPLRMFFIPANSTATAVFQILNDNDGNGLMFETEGDTLAQTFKSEHGNYSDGFRKAFHHEKISYLRRKDREKVELETPKLSAVLSGTPKQIQTLVHDSENGLFSRFMFYYMDIQLKWIDVFADNGEPLDRVFDRYGEQFFEFYERIKANGDMTFELTKEQQKRFNEYFSDLQVEYFDFCGKDYIGTVRRLGIITFRIAMVLSAIGIMDTGDFSELITCSDTDFNTSIEISKVLVKHAAQVFRSLPEVESPLQGKRKPKYELLNALPDRFDRTQYLEFAGKLGIPISTADKQIKRYLNNGLIFKNDFNLYEKKGYDQKK